MKHICSGFEVYLQVFVFPGVTESIILDTAGPSDVATTCPKMDGNGSGSRKTSMGDDGRSVTPLEPARCPKASLTMALIPDLNASMDIPKTGIVPSQRPANNTGWSDVNRQMTPCTQTAHQRTDNYSVNHCIVHTAVWPTPPTTSPSLRPSTRVSRPATTIASRFAHKGW